MLLYSAMSRPIAADQTYDIARALTTERTTLASFAPITIDVGDLSLFVGIVPATIGFPATAFSRGLTTIIRHGSAAREQP
jgi:hypothetical protein